MKSNKNASHLIANRPLVNRSMSYKLGLPHGDPSTTWILPPPKSYGKILTCLLEIPQTNLIENITFQLATYAGVNNAILEQKL